MTDDQADPEGLKPETPELVRLEVVTRHPWDYVLVNEADGTRWRGTPSGEWRLVGRQ